MSLRISRQDSLFMLIDMQQKLAPAMWAGEQAITCNYKILQAADFLGIPHLVTEQYPQGIGHTVELVKPLIDPDCVLEKMTFSCMADAVIADRLVALGRKQIVVAGMETHVCVLQTVLDMIDLGYQVFVVDDAVASRTAENKMLGLKRMQQAGAQIVSSEMILFEWLERAGTEEFKKVLPLIK